MVSVRLFFFRKSAAPCPGTGKGRLCTVREWMRQNFTWKRKKRENKFFSENCSQKYYFCEQFFQTDFSVRFETRSPGTARERQDYEKTGDYSMRYEVKGGSFPVVICHLEDGERMITEKGSMIWMTTNMQMDTRGGGLGKMFSKALSGESIFQNTYTAKVEEVGSQEMLEYFQGKAAEMSYTVGEAQVDKDHATVPVTFTYVDASEVLQETLVDYIGQGLSLAMSGAGEEELQQLFTDIFTEKTAAIETGTATAEVNFPCEKVDGAWKISSLPEEEQDALLQVLTCNLTAAIDAMDEAVSGSGEPQA